jgi:4-amino-4-deoxy-L-arabinose transferase-like glycosyltransferase
MQTLGKEVSQPPGFHKINHTLPPVGNWAFIAAILLAAFYLATSLYISSHRLLWVDEILTVLNTRLPSSTAIWKAATEGADGLPPIYFMVIRSFDEVFGRTDLSIRLPSALALAAGLLLTFDCARRLTDGLHGLIALSVLCCSFLPYYGHEARSYALYFMFAGLALWIWVYDKDNSWVGALFFGVAIFLAVGMHYYAILCLVPYVVLEVTNWRPWRLPSRKMIAALLGMACAAAVLWVPIQAGRRQFRPDFWANPTVDLLRDALPGIFPDGLLLLVLIVVWIALSSSRDKSISLQAMPAAERAGWFFLLIPLAGYLLAKITHVFQLRYFVCMLPGVAVAFSCWVWRHFQGAWRVSIGVFLILATWGVAKQVTAVRDPNRFYYSPIRQILGMENTLRDDGKRYFVLCHQGRYAEARHYSSHPEEYALLTSLDHGNLHETMILAQYHAMQFWTLEDLRKHARETALISPLPSDLDTLKQAGFQTRIRFTKPLTVVYFE